MPFIFRSKIRLKNGTVIYAKDRNKKAFRIWVDEVDLPISDSGNA